MLTPLLSTDTHTTFGREDGSTVTYPRVTAVLAHHFPLLVNPDVLEQAAARGTYVHKAAHYLDGGGDGSGLAWYRLNPLYKPYLLAYQRFLEETQAAVLSDTAGVRLSEQRIVNELHGYTGTPDRAMELRRGRHRIWAVIDLKTGVALKQHRLQTAAYEEPLRKRVNRRLPLQRACVYLKTTGNYVLDWHDSPRDWAAWLGCLQVFNWEAAP